jgi:hypothetical protein
VEWVRAPFVQALLWTVAALAAVWILGPAVAVLLRLGRIELESEVDEDPARAEPRENNAAYEAKFRSLVALGFRPAGVTFASTRFFSPLHWSWRSHGERWLVSADRKIFFDLFRVAGGGPWRSCAITLFEGNGFLETACSRANLEVLKGDQRRVEIEEVDPPALVARHEAFVAAFSRERGLPARPSTLREISAASCAFCSRTHPRLLLGLGMAPVLFTFLIPAGIALQKLGRPGGGAAPLMICAAAVTFAFIRWLLLPGPLPMLLRLGVLLGLSSVVPLSSISQLAATLGIEHSIDRLEAVDNEGSPAALGRAVDRFTDLYDEKGCDAVVRRLESPSTAPGPRQGLRRILVRWAGIDLGDDSTAWRSWCEARLKKTKR